MPPLDTDIAGHPNHAPSTGAPATIVRFANASYPWTIPHVAPPGYTYKHQPLHFSLSLPATLPIYPHEACHRLSSLPHMRLRLQPAVLGNVYQLLIQTSVPDPHLTHGKYFGVRSAAAPPTAAAFQPQPTLLRRPSVQSPTPPGSSLTTTPKTLHRQPQTTALN